MCGTVYCGLTGRAGASEDNSQHYQASESHHCFIQEQPWKRARRGQHVLGHLRVNQGMCSPPLTVAPHAAMRPTLTSGFRNSLDMFSASTYKYVSLAYAPCQFHSSAHNSTL